MSGIQAPWIGCSYEDYEERHKHHFYEYDSENDEYYTDDEEFEEDDCEDCKLHFDENGNLINEQANDI